MTGRAWQQLAEALAGQPLTVRRLLAAHVAVGGRCAACSTPGTGTPGAVWPCSIHDIAALADEIHASRAGRPLRGRPG